MAPALKNPIQRLLETEEKGRGLALFGWAGVTVFAFLAAFASWQFAPARGNNRLARVDDTYANDITAGIRTGTARPVNGRVATVPTPLPGDGSISKDDVEAIRQELKELRRVVGRVDVSTDVLARRISNLEDSLGTSATSTVKPARPLQALTPITPQTVVAPPPQNAPPAPQATVQPSQAAPVPQATTPAPNPPVTPPASAMPVQPVVQIPPAPLAHIPAAPRALPTDPAAQKAQLERSAADQANLERLLMQRGQGMDPQTSLMGQQRDDTFIPPLVDAMSVVPKSRPNAPLPLPVKPTMQPNQPTTATAPQPMPPPAPEPRPLADAKPLPDVASTGSVLQRQVLPIDPTRAVPVKPVTSAQPPAPLVNAGVMTPDEQKLASEKMALALRSGAEQTASIKPPAEPVVIAPPAAQPEKPAQAADIFGIDLGGYKSIGQVKKTWIDLEIRQGKLAKALTPLARLGEASDGVEIRLIAGPFTDKEAAKRACQQLRGGTAKCDPVAYQGEPIQSKAPVQKPVADRKPLDLSTVR